ncbi:unnamed protein product [Musa acuminata subsp. burmannicoides]
MCMTNETNGPYHKVGSAQIHLKFEYETSYTLKFIGQKEVILRPLYSLCLALNGLGIYLINYQINGSLFEMNAIC